MSRAVGLFLPRRSSLRRRSDRIEVGARWVVLLLGLLFLPVALTIGSEVAASFEVEAAAQRAERHQVTAVVLAEPEDQAATRPDVAVGDLRAPVRWIGADGTPHVALVRVPAEARPGDPRALWVDRGDHPTAAPLSPSQSGAQGMLAGVALVLGDLVVSVLLLAGLRGALDRARLRAWDEDWRRFTGPDTESRR